MNSNIKSVCVYCGSSAKAAEIFRQVASRLGQILAENNLRLIYGGGHVGLMGIVADSVLNEGGEAIGVIPYHIADKEIAHSGLTELHIVDSMHQRKQMMVDLADAFLILPGGLGTMDEFFEIFTWWQLGLHNKPVIIVNVEGYWTPLLDTIDSIIKHQFARPEDRDYLIIIDTVDQVPEALARAPGKNTGAETKWM